jgi:hypothetical protein
MCPVNNPENLSMQPETLNLRPLKARNNAEIMQKKKMTPKTLENNKK